MTDRALARHAGAARLRSAVESPAAATMLVGVLIVAGFVSWALLSRHVLAPWVMVDELQYALASRSFISTGHYLFREQPESIRSIYPALISPAWLAGSTHTAYTLVKVINSVLMAAGAIPLFLWARRLVAPWWALLVVALYFAMPDFAYTGEILTENAYVPAMILALFAIAVAIERPTVVRQLLALGAIGLAVSTRVQGLMLLILLPVAIGLALLLDGVAAAPGERRRVVTSRLRRFWPSLGGLVLCVLLYVAYQTARGVSLGSGLGIYQQVSRVHYAFVPTLRWSVYHLGELAFAAGMLPVAALIVLFGLACRRETAPTAAERAFLAVAATAVVLTVVQIGAFASRFSLRIEERYMFNVIPVLFLALVVWLARGLPRPPALTAAAVLVPVAFLFAVPFESLISSGAFHTDTFGLFPVWRLSLHFSGGLADVRILLGLGALVAGLLFACLPRRWARVAVPVAVAGFLVLSAESVFGQVTFLSSSTRLAGGLTGDPSWIDHAIGKNKRVEFLYTTDIDANPHVLWQSEFWNRSVRRVFGVNAEVPSIADVIAPLDAASGRIVPQLPAGSPDVKPRYVVAASNVHVNGAPLAHAGQLSLFRVRPPLRLATITSGITQDGWTSPSAVYTRFIPAPRGAHVVVAVSRPPLNGPPPARVTVTVAPLSGGRVWQQQSWTLRNGATHHFDLPVRHAPFQVRLAVTPPFVPSQFGYADTRTLGVHATIGLR
ncbi:MAG TPA: hypothetical protein VI142_10585 [Gaiellaceae bacterium]